MKKISTILIVLVILSSLLSSCGGTSGEAGLVLIAVNVYNKPGPKGTAGRKYVATIKRGETVTKKDMKGKFIKILLSDGETTGWVESKWIFIGPKKPITFIENQKLYSRPDTQSPVRYRVTKGQNGYITKQNKQGWYKINIKGYWAVGWVKEGSFERGIVKVKRKERKINLSGFVYVDSENGLKMRKDAHTEAAEVAVLSYGTKVQIVSQSPGPETIAGRKGLWTEIKWKDKQGWVFGGFLHQSKP